MENADNYYSLVTGASSGIGRALSEELARRGRNLLLIALPDSAVEIQSKSLSLKYNIICRYFEIDFREWDSPAKIFSFSKAENLRINLLVNNVGVGHIGNMGDFLVDEIREMIMLNIYTTTTLTNLFLHQLKECPESYILNIGSLGGFSPAPYKSIYIATKAYILFFSYGLSAELENSSVKVCAAVPGAVPSNQKMIDRIKGSGRIGRLMALSPDKVAKYIIPRLFLGQKVIIPGVITRALYWLGFVLPHGIVLHIMKGLFLNKK
jgi:uncharacterized protein